jgi:hypothetical protein
VRRAPRGARVPRGLLPAAVGVAIALTVAGCAQNAQNAQPALGPTPNTAARWLRFRHVTGVVDLAGRSDGSFVVAADGRLFSWPASGAPVPFARGPGGYSTPRGPEPYIAVAGGDRVAGAGCSFRAGTIFALRPGARPGVVEVTAAGRTAPFASLAAADAPGGIAYDSTGAFGHALLVTARTPGGTAVLAIDCRGRVRTLTGRAPVMEGGIAVAPPSFGRYRGDLIAPGERSGLIFAVRPNGAVAVLAVSGLPHGGDIGVESAGFVPPGFGAGGSAYLADRFSAGNAHPGSDSILRLPGAELAAAGVRPGDLLVATEAGARTVAVRCAMRCTVRYVAAGPGSTHAEGHIAFAQR